jgi:hypothetical protein
MPELEELLTQQRMRWSFGFGPSARRPRVIKKNTHRCIFFCVAYIFFGLMLICTSFPSLNLT